MKILFVTSECAPFSKSGGLADVAFSLPPALAAEDNEIEIITPLYKCVRDRFMDQLTYVKNCYIRLGNADLYCGLWKGDRDGVTVWFIDNQDLFDRPKLYGYDDDKFRFAWFSKAVVSLVGELSFIPNIIHCNDWETALVCIYLKNDAPYRKELRNIKTVYTIHNIAYQGQFGEDDLTTTFALPYGWYDGGLGYEYQGRRDINLMKGAMLMADAVSTVSPTYARELHQPKFGRGLEGVVDMIESKLYGILNGIDMNHYDPSLDKRIPYAFSIDDMDGKAKCKKAIQEKFGLDQHSHWPLLASVARLVEQKGIELIKEILPGLMEMGVQVIVFGQGEQHYIDYFTECTKRWPGQFGFSSDYSEQVAAEVFAGADFYLMPSSFEPCGLSQMMAMRYGTVPIVHETGGLKDSIRPYSDFDGVGDGFSFSTYDGKSLYLEIFEAVKVFFGDKETFKLIQRRCMVKDFSWKKASEQYMRMYGEISSGDGIGLVSFEDAFEILKGIYEEIDDHNRRHHLEEYYPEGFKNVVQVHIEGAGEGTFYVKFTRDFPVEVMPYAYDNADCYISSSFDNLFNIATGRVTHEKMFINGQMKVSGNISKSAELRYLLSRVMK